MEPVYPSGDIRTPPESDVSVVICASTERRFDMLCGAITSVQGQEPHVREIIVVIDYNASLLRRIGATFPEIRVLSNSAKQGYPGARNTGARAARGAIVAFLDDDAVAATDWIQRLTAVLSARMCWVEVERYYLDGRTKPRPAGFPMNSCGLSVAATEAYLTISPRSATRLEQTWRSSDLS